MRHNLNQGPPPAARSHKGMHTFVRLDQLFQKTTRSGGILSQWLSRHPVVQGVAITALTAIGITAGLRGFEHVIPNINGWAIYWPFNGIIAAVMLMTRRRIWPWIAAGLVCAFGRNEIIAAEPFAEIATDVLSNLAEVLIAAFALPPFRSLKQWMMEPHLVSRFAGGAVLVGPALISLPVAWYFNYTYHTGFFRLAVRWGFADALGAALWMPLVLVLFSSDTYRLFRWRVLPKTVSELGILYAVSWLTFHQHRYPLAFLPYPFLLMVALRLGFSGAVIGANMLALIAASLSLRGMGPLVPASGSWTDAETFVLQVFSTLAVLFVFPLSVKLIERRNFEEKLQEAYADMEQLATMDKLTGVANRRRFDQALETEWKRAAQGTTPVCLMMIDADCFKAYNDRYGHLAGDDCLRHIAAALRSERLRPHDLVARYGGEEFAILLPGTAAEQALRLAETMRLAVSSAALEHEGNPFGHVTISVGLASLSPGPDTPPEDLILAADAALYSAKQGGRNRVECATGIKAVDRRVRRLLTAEHQQGQSS